MSVHLILSNKSLKPSSHFLILFFLLLLWLYEILCPVIKFTGLFLCFISLLLNPCGLFFSSVIVSFSSMTSFSIFLIFSLCWRATSPTLKGVTSWKKWTLFFNPAPVLDGLWKFLWTSQYYFVFNSPQYLRLCQDPSKSQRWGSQPVPNFRLIRS